MQLNFVNHIRRFVDLSDDEVLLLNKSIKSYNLRKKENILTEGEVCKSVYFVEKGCLRMFFINNKTVEQITQFALDGWWISDYGSFMDNKPSEYHIQAIEKSEIIGIDALMFVKLLKEIPQLEKYFRIIMQKAVAASQHLAKLKYQMSKEEFYQHFVIAFPEFNQRVPQYMIASYLGLTPEYVSELRKKR